MVSINLSRTCFNKIDLNLGVKLMQVAWLVRTDKPLYNGHLGERGRQVLKKGTTDIPQALIQSTY